MWNPLYLQVKPHVRRNRNRDGGGTLSFFTIKPQAFARREPKTTITPLSKPLNPEAESLENLWDRSSLFSLLRSISASSSFPFPLLIISTPLSFTYHCQLLLLQHYMVNSSINEQLATVARVEEGDCVLEIGPGTGALTQVLLDAGATVLAIEKVLSLSLSLSHLY